MEKSIRTVFAPHESEKIIEKSRFITYSAHVESEEEARGFVAKIRSQHSLATHVCYAFISDKTGNLQRFSDDGEPQGTAGMPVLDVIRKSGVDDATVVVTRYFGGILLGAGGLVRAYAAAAKMALDAAGIVSYESYTELSLTCSYSDHQKLSAELPKFGAILDDTIYADNVTLKFAVKDEVADAVMGKIREMSGGKLLPQILGHRFDYQP